MRPPFLFSQILTFFCFFDKIFLLIELNNKMLKE